jgi:hypothetical protein
MDDIKVIKPIFTVNLASMISDTADETKGEAQVGYTYDLDGSLPELAYAVAGFLKMADQDPDMAKVISDGSPVGENFITLVKMYYDKKDE